MQTFKERIKEKPWSPSEEFPDFYESPKEQFQKREILITKD